EGGGRYSVIFVGGGGRLDKGRRPGRGGQLGGPGGAVESQSTALEVGRDGVDGIEYGAFVVPGDAGEGRDLDRLVGNEQDALNNELQAVVIGGRHVLPGSYGRGSPGGSLPGPRSSLP